jgi:hypothetical protein
MSVALLAEIITGAIPSIFPFWVLIVTFCHPIHMDMTRNLAE